MRRAITMDIKKIPAIGCVNETLYLLLAAYRFLFLFCHSKAAFNAGKTTGIKNNILTH
jgi:hypothetical protein